MNQEVADQKMFGCNRIDLDEYFTNKAWGPLELRVMSILSDVQELISNPTPKSLEAARQFLNRAKYGLSEHGLKIKLEDQESTPRVDAESAQ